MNGFLKNIYNVYLKNAYGKCVYHDFLQFDRMIHANYPEYEEAVKQRYRYISIASGLPASFYVTHKNYHTHKFHSLSSIRTPPFKYRSDGNGRDSYIISNNGGLSYNNLPLIENIPL